MIYVRNRPTKARLGLALLFALALAASACSSDDSTDTNAGATTPTSGGAQPQGGDLVFGAEQDFDCADWMASCAGASWGVYMFQALTMPRSFDFDDNKYKPSPLLDGEPKLESSPKQVVTYKINPRAVWNDGTPITSEDYKYTWEQVTTSPGIYSKAGYEKVESVATPDPKTAVVTFKEPYGAWRDIFGGYFGIYPSHLLKGKDRNALMKDGYKFSGGPWILEAWNKTVDIKLVPNPNYWDKKPNLNSITFRLIEDTAAAQSALRSGQVSMLYPQAQPGLENLKTLPGIKFQAITSLSYESVWINTTKAPFTTKPVRQALAYAIDRDAIVKQLFEPIQPGIKRIDSFATPAYNENYVTPFSKYSPVNSAKVNELMTGDGWTKGADGFWAKGAEKATFEVKTTQGNRRRLQTLEIMQSQLKAQGFNMTINPIRSTVLFGEDAPKGNFQAALYAQVPASNDPDQCALWCSKNIPGPANENSGQNWTRLSDPAIDEAYLAIEKETDTKKVTELVGKGQAAIAEGVPAIPIDPFPDIIAFQEDVVGGEVRHNPSFGPWVYANTWFAKKR